MDRRQALFGLAALPFAAMQRPTVKVKGRVQSFTTSTWMNCTGQYDPLAAMRRKAMEELADSVERSVWGDD